MGVFDAVGPDGRVGECSDARVRVVGEDPIDFVAGALLKMLFGNLSDQSVAYVPPGQGGSREETDQ